MVCHRHHGLYCCTMLVSAFVSVYVYIDKMGKTVIVVSKCLFWSTEKLCGTELNERRRSLVIETVDPKIKSLLVYTLSSPPVAGVW